MNSSLSKDNEREIKLTLNEDHSLKNNYTDNNNIYSSENNLKNEHQDQNIHQNQNEIFKKSYNGMHNNSNEHINDQNKNSFIEKMKFAKFISLNMKSEQSYDQFLTLIFWTSNIEIGFFILAVILSRFNPFIFILSIHLIKSVLGYVMICYLPKSEVLVNSIDFKNNSLSLDQIQEEIKNKLLLLLDSCCLKAYLIMYWVLIICNIIIDGFVAFVIFILFTDSDYGGNGLITYIALTPLVCKLFFN